jgi:hypothetical protein
MPVIGAAAVLLVLAGLAAFQCHRSVARNAFEAGARFGRGRPAETCLEEIRRRSLAGGRSLLGLADTAFAEGCFGAAAGNLLRCASIPRAESEEGYAWRSQLCGEVGPETTGCHFQLGAVQDWCDREEPAD